MSNTNGHEWWYGHQAGYGGTGGTFTAGATWGALGATGKHAYLSTACLHGKHDECRLVCKFCDSPCACHHHRVENQ